MTTAREADPLVIDLSGVEKMDTVGAWLVYRTVRDRGAKVTGASPDAVRAALRAPDRPRRPCPAPYGTVRDIRPGAVRTAS